MQKWDQKAWNVYFPIIFTNHIGAIALIIVYIPYTYAVVIGFLQARAHGQILGEHNGAPRPIQRTRKNTETEGRTQSHGLGRCPFYQC